MEKWKEVLEGWHLIWADKYDLPTEEDNYLVAMVDKDSPFEPFTAESMYYPDGSLDFGWSAENETHSVIAWKNMEKFEVLVSSLIFEEE